ncbi:MAG: hypothetical protein LC798_03250 [Chloroflexi bacterium]|nr:hypothetical protein [Chloroflexota bacterium]
MSTQTERPVALGPVRELIARVCRLQEKAKAEALGYDHSTDCFCGEGGFWRVGDSWPEPNECWRNDGTAVAFIEAAVEEKIARYRWRLYAREVGGQVQALLAAICRLPRTP